MNRDEFRRCDQRRLRPLTGVVLLALCSCSPTDPPNMEESASVTVNGVRFSAAMEKTWLFDLRHWPAELPPGKAPHEECVAVQLRIHNDTDRPLYFSTFDTYGLVLDGPDGRRVYGEGGRDWTTYTPPVYIWSKSSSTIRCSTFLIRRKSENRLIYRDDTGMSLSYGPLAAGMYRASIAYSNGDGKTKFGAPASDARTEIQGTKVWSGLAETPPIAIEVTQR
jgi:hypothetical protein